MGSVLAKLLDYGGFRDFGCAPGFPLKEAEEEEKEKGEGEKEKEEEKKKGERYLGVDAIFSSWEQNIINLNLMHCTGIWYSIIVNTK